MVRNEICVPCTLIHSSTKHFKAHGAQLRHKTEKFSIKAVHFTTLLLANVQGTVMFKGIHEVNQKERLGLKSQQWENPVSWTFDYKVFCQKSNQPQGYHHWKIRFYVHFIPSSILGWYIALITWTLHSWIAAVLWRYTCKGPLPKHCRSHTASKNKPRSYAGPNRWKAMNSKQKIRFSVPYLPLSYREILNFCYQRFWSKLKNYTTSVMLELLQVNFHGFLDNSMYYNRSWTHHS